VQKIEMPNWAAHLPLEGEEAEPINNDLVDLTPHVREAILLGFPQHPLCKSDCAGLARKSDVPKDEPSSAWEELNKLKFN
jgi:uncharacterized metal-binding protein YceD (DUF177 family)